MLPTVRLRAYDYKSDNIDPVTLKTPQTTVCTKDALIYVGDKWEAKDSFVAAADKDGDAVDLKNVMVTGADQVNTDKTGTYTVTYAYAGITKNATVTVKEKVTPVTRYTVTFKAEKGGTISRTTSVKVNKDAKVTTLPTVKTTTGYTFIGRYEGTKKVNPKTVVIKGNTTFTAKFKKNASSTPTTSKPKPADVKSVAMYPCTAYTIQTAESTSTLLALTNE